MKKLYAILFASILAVAFAAGCTQPAQQSGASQQPSQQEAPNITESDIDATTANQDDLPELPIPDASF